MKELIHLIDLCSRKFSSRYAVFDALDECRDACQMEVLRLFVHLQQSGYRLLISSRPHLHKFLCQLNDAQTLEIHVNASDLENYITTRLSKEGNISDKFKDKCLGLINDVGGM